ncbi:MAG TPA: NUDIX hydrolase [Tepidisphaeraceae bacterium]|jgi:ADP-ribose pyrophosphatase|nr:NUDIX hydrolase [Tepidisphaeraceae bacterium]
MPYRLLEKQVIYDGAKCRLELHQLENEQTGKRHSREVVAHNGAVLVMGFLDDGRVLLIRNRRYAVGQTLIELPAGTLEKGEEPIKCAARELLEETGYQASRVEPLLTFFTSPGILSERMHVFAAYDLENKGMALEEGEDIEVMPTKWNDAMSMALDGRIQDGKTIAAVLWYDRVRGTNGSVGE